jgi:hypothetical protein
MFGLFAGMGKWWHVMVLPSQRQAQGAHRAGMGGVAAANPLD